MISLIHGSEYGTYKQCIEVKQTACDMINVFTPCYMPVELRSPYFLLVEYYVISGTLDLLFFRVDCNYVFCKN